MLDIIIQIIIFTTEAIAMLLTQQSNENLKKYAPIIGMAGEPFWIYASLNANQWGILGLSIIYSFIWGLGIYNYWIKKG